MHIQPILGPLSRKISLHAASKSWFGGIGFTFAFASIGYGLSSIPGLHLIGQMACCHPACCLLSAFYRLSGAASFRYSILQQAAAEVCYCSIWTEAEYWCCASSRTWIARSRCGNGCVSDWNHTTSLQMVQGRLLLIAASWYRYRRMRSSGDCSRVPDS